MNELTMYQYSVKVGEKVILVAKITGDAIVKVGTPMQPAGPNRWEFTIPAAQNYVFQVLATFVNPPAGSQVDFAIDGEIGGVSGNGPFSVFPITPASGIKDPQFVLAVR